MHERIFRTAVSLLVPAVLIASSSFVGYTKPDTQTLSTHKTAFKNSVTTPQTVIFEADEELEDDDLSDPNLLLRKLPGFHGVTLASEPAILQREHHPAFQIEYSSSPRAPPAL